MVATSSWSTTTRCWRIAGWSIRAASASRKTGRCRPSRKSTIRCWPRSGIRRCAGAQIDRALGALGHVVEAEGRQWVFVYRELRRYSSQSEPWLVGQYFPIEDATGDLDRLTNGAIVGAATLAVAVLLALLIGLRMARSIRTITSAAEAIERLEFDQPFHRGSRLREIDDAGHSLDKARGALKWFGAYVPHRLVFRLMELGEDARAPRGGATSR